MAIKVEAFDQLMPAELQTALNAFANPVGYTDSSGTPGAATANTSTGRAAIANGASSIVITNSLVTANSIVLVEKEDTDAALISKVVPTTGSFTLTMSTTVSSNVKFRWHVVGTR